MNHLFKYTQQGDFYTVGIFDTKDTDNPTGQVMLDAEQLEAWKDRFDDCEWIQE